ncbi:nucleoside phosphorylase domain-containing protein [Aspergillus floccosus]
MEQEERGSPDYPGYYSVAWICALEEEYQCACRMLDEELPGPTTIDDNDTNMYVFGRIAEHRMVIACLPSGRCGMSSAARVARDMVRTFPRLSFALVVGIGSGEPTPQNDIRLGDVVVSQPVDGCGGVIQYDFGKKLQNGRFQRTDQLNGPPERLLGVLQEMKRRYKDKRLPDRLAEHLTRMDDMDDYQKPDDDRLYQTDYLHVGGKDCNQCDPHKKVERSSRRNGRAINVHYGTIASGNCVLEDAVMRDAYATEPELNVLCFEREAAGLMNILPSLVIRGVCDYCDSHKNDEWHKYAALTAAAYARELLLVLRPQRADTMPVWAGQVLHELRKVDQKMTNIIQAQMAIHNRLISIEQKLDSARSAVSKGVEFNSYDTHDEFLPGCRLQLLDEVAESANSRHGNAYSD